MTITEAIEILKSHNEWRRGGEGEMTNPAVLGVAINLIIEHYENNIKGGE